MYSSRCDLTVQTILNFCQNATAVCVILQPHDSQQYGLFKGAECISHCAYIVGNIGIKSSFREFSDVESAVVKTFPPGPKSLIPSRDVLAFRRDPLAFLTSMARFGDIAHFRSGSQHFFVVSDPEHIKDILTTHNASFKKGRALERAKRLLGNGLLTSEGEFHHRQRRLAQPAFHRDRIARYAGIMAGYADRAQRERWGDGETVDIAREMNRLTLAIVGKTLFDTETEAEAEQVRQAVSESVKGFNRSLMPFAEILDRLPLPQNRRYRQARSVLNSIIFRIIEERRRSGGDRGDLLSMLLTAQDEEGDGGQMDDRQLRDEVMTIFLAGHETTANALTWAWYLLSQHPQAEEKLHRELDTVLAGRLPTADDFPRLQYTEMVIAETMRLYPPAWTVARRALKDYPLGEYVVPAGSLVLMSQWVVHHDPRYFPDPFRFDPDRWTPEARASRPQFSYFPFGGGPRRCIGDGFALMEAIMVLAALGQSWRLRHLPGARVAVHPLITLRPKYGMPMVLAARAERVKIQAS
jgi:cytochrome P450